MSARTRVVCWVMAIAAGVLIGAYGPPLDPFWRWKVGRCWVWQIGCSP